METRPGGVSERGDSEVATVRKGMVDYALVAQSLVAIMSDGATPGWTLTVLPECMKRKENCDLIFYVL